MKKIFTLLILAIIFSCAKSNKNDSSYNMDEIIFVVEMDSNENKSIEDIAKFSEEYTDTIDTNEPNTLGWGFYKSGDQIVLIERYLDGAAMMQHGKNVSQPLVQLQFLQKCHI